MIRFSDPNLMTKFESRQPQPFGKKQILIIKRSHQLNCQGFFVVRSLALKPFLLPLRCHGPMSGHLKQLKLDGSHENSWKNIGHKKAPFHSACQWLKKGLLKLMEIHSNGCFFRSLNKKRIWTHKGAAVTATLKCVRLHSPPFYGSFFMVLYLFSCRFICGTAGHLGALHQKRQVVTRTYKSGWIDVFLHQENHVTKFQGVKGGLSELFNSVKVHGCIIDFCICVTCQCV